MPVNLTDALQRSTYGPIANTFLPLGYPLFLTPGIWLAGVHGAIFLQFLLQIAIAYVSVCILRQLQVPSRWASIGALPVALHPVLLLSILKIWDVPISTFVYLLLVLCCLKLLHTAGRSFWWALIVTSLTAGIAVFCRPNYMLLIPVVFIAVLRLSRRSKSVPLWTSALALSFLTLASYSALSFAAHGSLFFPRNGPYNLYAGHNSKTAQSLLKHLNAEPALVESVLEAHPGDPSPDFQSAATDAGYRRAAIMFALHHPGVEAKLIPLKLFTFFRPDTKVHRLASVQGIGQAAMALPILIFLVALLLPGRPTLEFTDTLLLWFNAAYLFPFLVTNSDPRFRMALDALLLLHSVSLFYRRLHPRSEDMRVEVEKCSS